MCLHLFKLRESRLRICMRCSNPATVNPHSSSSPPPTLFWKHDFLILTLLKDRNAASVHSGYFCVDVCPSSLISNEKTDGPTERSLSSQCECVLSFTNIQTAENVFKSAVETAFIRHLDSCVGLRFG